VQFAVPRKASHATESLATDGTTEQLCPRVHRHMILQGAILAKRPLAHRTLVGFFPGVYPPVCRETARRREPILADRTLESLLAAVCLHVQTQMFRAAEHFAAERALVRFFPAVDSGMTREMPDPGKPLVADGAFKWFLAGVASVVDRQRRRAAEAFAALGAEVSQLVGGFGGGPALAVGGLMAQEPALGHKSLVTDGAFVGLHSAVGSRVNYQVCAARESFIARRASKRPRFTVLRVPLAAVFRLYLRIFYTHIDTIQTHQIVQIQCITYTVW